jgi:hypothetical protein
MASSTSTAKACPSCAAPTTTGRFCSECGAAVGDAVCAGCRSLLSPGAKFCHRCGTAVGTQPASPVATHSTANVLPWAVAAIAMLAVVALVASQRFGGTRAPTAASPADAPFASAGAAGSAGRAPDISNLSPRERADRLFDRMMRLSSEGKADSVQFFAPMAISVYQSLGALDADLRQHPRERFDASARSRPRGSCRPATRRLDERHHISSPVARRRAEGIGETTPGISAPPERHSRGTR